MAESTLTLSMNDLTGEAGSFLGWGRDPARWSARKLEDLNAVLATALRRFYFQAGHEWTFLKPRATLALVAEEKAIPLPEDFGGFEGDAMIALSGSSGGYWPIRQVAAEQIRAQYALTDTVTGRPMYFADEPRRGVTEVRSSRNNLLIYPLPDNAYSFECTYSILPEFLTERNPWPYGGAAHAETLKAGVRAAAELYEDAEAGPQTANYVQSLKASIDYDRRHQPKTLGVNVDRSDSIGKIGGMWPDGLWTPLGIGYLGTVSYT